MDSLWLSGLWELSWFWPDKLLALLMINRLDLGSVQKGQGCLPVVLFDVKISEAEWQQMRLLAPKDGLSGLPAPNT